MHNTYHKVSRRIDIALWQWNMDEGMAYDKKWWANALGRMRKWNMTCHCGCNRRGRYKHDGGGLGYAKKHLRKRKGWNKKKAEIYRFYEEPTPEDVLYEFHCGLKDEMYRIMERRRYEEKNKIERFGHGHDLA